MPTVPMAAGAWGLGAKAPKCQGGNVAACPAIQPMAANPRVAASQGLNCVFSDDIFGFNLLKINPKCYQKR